MTEINQLLELLRSRPADDWARLVRDRYERGGSRPTGPRDVYVQAREHFARREEQLRRDDAVAERLVAGLREERSRPAPTPPQLSVQLVAAADEQARGRFVLDNPTALTRTLTFRPSELRGPRGDAWVPTRLAPARVVLAPGEGSTIEISVDVSGAMAPRERAELDVEVHADGRTVAIVWVTIETTP